MRAIEIGLAAAVLVLLGPRRAESSDRVEAPRLLPPGETAWRDSHRGGIRGLTVGPIESSLHPGKGYGSAACARSLSEASRLGATWVSLTPFARVWDLSPTGLDLTFETPFARNKKAVAAAVRQAHAAGLRVLIVPHLWVEQPGWRGEINPGDDAAWAEWAKAYRRFVLEWAKIAESAGADMYSVGVELRSFATTTRAPLLSGIVHDVRRTYHGLLTYAANWDDVDDTVIWSDLDVIGLNAFFPLADKRGASFETLEQGGKNVALHLRELAATWHKPIMFNEIGYTTRKDPAVEPWIWPDAMKGVVIDQRAQAEAFAALLSPLLDEPWFAGFFVWRIYADPDDMSQEAEWGFSPRGKLAELVVRDALAATWAADGPSAPAGFVTPRAMGVGTF